MSYKTLTCPVCGRENIEELEDKCPQCNSDLTCFKVLDSIPDESPPEQKFPEGFTEIPKKLDRLQLAIEKIPESICPDSRLNEPYPKNTGKEASGKIPYFPIFTFLVMAFVLLLSAFLFVRINDLEKTLAQNSSFTSSELQKRDAEIRKLMEKYLELDKRVSVELIKQELKYNQLLDEKTKQIITRIDSLAEKNMKIQNDITNALEKSAGILADRHEKLSEKLELQLKKSEENSNKKIERISEEIISLLKEINKNRQLADKSLNQKLEDQRLETMELLKKLEKTLKDNAEKKKNVLSLINIDLL